MFQEKNKDLTLKNAKKNITYKIDKITAKDNLKQFLTSIGCYEGIEITLLSKMSGSYIVNILNSRFALNSKIANTIYLKNIN